MDAKCFVCNYERKTDWINGEEKVITRETDFISIDGTFLIDGTDYYQTPHRIGLYACPKCGTVRIAPEHLE